MKQLKKTLSQLIIRSKELYRRKGNKTLVVSHPVLDYLSKRYYMNTKGVQREPDEFLTSAQFMELKAVLRKHPARWMIWEGLPLMGPVDKLKAIGVKCIDFDYCGNVPGKGDITINVS